MEKETITIYSITHNLRVKLLRWLLGTFGIKVLPYNFVEEIIIAITGENNANIINAITIPIPISVSPKCLFIYLIIL